MSSSISDEDISINDTLNDSVWKDSFDRLLDTKSVLREKNIIKPNVHASFNRNSSFEYSKNESNDFVNSYSSPKRALRVKALENARAKASRDKLKKGGKVGKVNRKGKNVKKAKNPPKITELASSIVSTPVSEKGKGPFFCPLSPVSDWQFTFFNTRTKGSSLSLAGQSDVRNRAAFLSNLTERTRMTDIPRTATTDETRPQWKDNELNSALGSVEAESWKTPARPSTDNVTLRKSQRNSRAQKSTVNEESNKEYEARRARCTRQRTELEEIVSSQNDKTSYVTERKSRQRKTTDKTLQIPDVIQSTLLSPRNAKSLSSSRRSNRKSRKSNHPRSTQTKLRNRTRQTAELAEKDEEHSAIVPNFPLDEFIFDTLENQSRTSLDETLPSFNDLVKLRPKQSQKKYKRKSDLRVSATDSSFCSSTTKSSNKTRRRRYQKEVNRLSDDVGSSGTSSELFMSLSNASLPSFGGLKSVEIESIADYSVQIIHDDHVDKRTSDDEQSMVLEKTDGLVDNCNFDCSRVLPTISEDEAENDIGKITSTSGIETMAYSEISSFTTSAKIANMTSKSSLSLSQRTTDLSSNFISNRRTRGESVQMVDVEKSMSGTRSTSLEASGSIAENSVHIVNESYVSRKPMALEKSNDFVENESFDSTRVSPTITENEESLQDKNETRESGPESVLEVIDESSERTVTSSAVGISKPSIVVSEHSTDLSSFVSRRKTRAKYTKSLEGSTNSIIDVSAQSIGNTTPHVSQLSTDLSSFISNRKTTDNSLTKNEKSIQSPSRLTEEVSVHSANVSSFISTRKSSRQVVQNITSKSSLEKSQRPSDLSSSSSFLNNRRTRGKRVQIVDVESPVPRKRSSRLRASETVTERTSRSSRFTNMTVFETVAEDAEMDLSTAPTEMQSTQNFNLTLQPGKWRRTLMSWKRQHSTIMLDETSNRTMSVLDYSRRTSIQTSMKRSRSKKSFQPIKEIEEARTAVLRRCDQTEPLDFATVYSDTALRHCRKIGEGAYGEVFLNKDEDGRDVVLKIIPIEGNYPVNGEQQKTFEQIFPEICISMELSQLRKDPKFSTSGFAEVRRVRCVRGAYPEHLVDLWELYRDNSGTENDHPEIFVAEQLFIVIELGNGGKDLEAFVYSNAEQALASFVQIALALSIAEQKFEFEHRDLHWGNVLLSATTDNDLEFKLNGRTVKIPTNGVKVTIIDYTLSRMMVNGYCLFNDLSTDDELFSASGDYQFDIYRLMKSTLGNRWERHQPYTNVLWLHYTIDKMIEGVRYRTKKHKNHLTYLETLKQEKDRLLEFRSATEYVEYYLAEKGW